MTKVSLPGDSSYTGEANYLTGHTYTFFTSATSGSVGTPGFGKPLERTLLF